MIGRNQLGTALVVLGVALFVVPAVFPLGTVLVHDTRPGTFDGADQLESNGIEVVAYENLTERGQELYVLALENGGEYRVPPGQGAPDFEYLSPEERAESEDPRPGLIAIERPENADLPRADEPFDRGPREGDDGAEQRREQAQRYDLVEFSQGAPSIDSMPQLLRLAAGVLAVVSFGVGGFLRSSK